MKKSLFKHFTAFFIAVTAMTSSLCCYALDSTKVTNFDYLKNNDGFSSCASSLYNYSDILEIDGNMDLAVIGEPFNLALLKDDYSVSQIDNATYFPVIIGNDIVAIITESRYYNEYGYSVGESFAKKLNTALNSSLALFSDNSNNLYGIDSSNNVFILSGNENVMNDLSMLQYDMISCHNNTISKSSIKSNTISLSTWGRTTRSTTSKTLSNYPKVKQTGSKCWAYTILSMAKYKLGSSKTIDDVLNAFQAGNGYAYDPDDGANLSEALNTIKQLFTSSIYNPKSYTSYLQSSQIKNSIDSNYPIYISGLNRFDSTKAHAEAIYGYIYSGTTVSNIFLMDPQEGTYTSAYNDPTNGWIFTDYSGNNYSWNKSITLRIF